MSGALFMMRPTVKKDLPYLQLMAQGQEVGIPPNYLEGGTCAVNADDVPVGYIHVEQTEHGPHVAPVVVFDNWRGHGVGTKLVRHAFREYGPLKLVSNGSSNGFYEKLGFVPVDWDEIESKFQRDCLTCEFYQQCGPKPYMLTEWKK
ncbi:MAG: GNAT family N-acetyltransferase [Coriobacteriales bacterium]|jgi:GNAT superfamily N-acetyltransferase